MIIAPTPIDAAPTVPVRGDRVTFVIQTQAWIAWEKVAYPQSTALGLNVYNNALEAFSFAQSAQAAANAASAGINAIAFNPVTVYTQWQGARSSINGRYYMRKTAGSSPTDPSADSANWDPLPARGITQNINTGVTMVEGILYVATGACSPLMPAAPGNGMRIEIMKTTGALVTCMRNGSNMGSVADDRYLGTANVVYTWMYVDAAIGWALLVD